MKQCVTGPGKSIEDGANGKQFPKILSQRIDVIAHALTLPAARFLPVICAARPNPIW
jgi:hypothetical protein